MTTRKPPPDELVEWLRQQCVVDADGKYAHDDLYASCTRRFGLRYTRAMLGHAVVSTFADDVHTRRIGARGQSRYTYVGLRSPHPEPQIRRTAGRPRLRRTVGLRVPADPEAARRFVRRVTAEIEELERVENVEYDSDTQLATEERRRRFK